MKKQDVEIFRRAVDQQRLVERGYLRAPELLDGSEIIDPRLRHQTFLDSQPSCSPVFSPLIGISAFISYPQ